MHEVVDLVERRIIPVKDGRNLEIEMSRPFIDRLRQHFFLSDDQQLTDDHIRSYVLESVNSAVVKAERELCDVNQAEDPSGIR